MALSGWIKLHRALSDHWLASNPDSLSVWVHMLMLANHAETKRQINGSVVVVLPGQIITSRRSLSEKTGVQESKVERILKRLESEQQITQRGLSKFRVISIVNWDEYQSNEQQSEQQVNSKRTAGEQQVNTPEEVLPDGNTKKGEEGKENNIGAPGKPERVKSISAKHLVSLGVDEQHAKDWLAIRKAKRAPLTETALDGVSREAQIAGLTLAQAIKESAERGWQGFKASWLASKPMNGQIVNRQQQVEDANARVVREIMARESGVDLGGVIAIDGEVIHVS
jgi:DNA-binding transcriptional regulator YhcF (GntR family)